MTTINTKNLPVILTRALLFAFISLSLIPSIFIDLLDIWSLFNAGFIALSLIIFLAGFSKISGITHGKISNQDKFGIFEKKISVLLIALTLTLAVSNSYGAPFYAQGYKFITIFFVMLISNELMKIISLERAIADYRTLVAIYIVGVFAGAMILPDALSPTGPTGTEYVRMDITGSETTQGILSAVFIILALTDFSSKRSPLVKAILMSVAAMAIYVFFMSGSRQALLAVIIYIALLMKSGGVLKRKGRDMLLKAVLLLFLLTTIFVLFTVFVDNSLYIRIFENPSEDYTTGRLDYSIKWIEAMEQNGAPLGFGYISKHSVQEIDFLWPSNEFVRFYVEGGPLGVVIIVLLMIYAIVALEIVLKYQKDDFIKGVTALLFSVIMVQISFDNYLHGTYRSLLYILMISLAAHYTLAQRNQRQPRTHINKNAAAGIPREALQ